MAQKLDRRQQVGLFSTATELYEQAKRPADFDVNTRLYTHQKGEKYYWTQDKTMRSTGRQKHLGGGMECQVYFKESTLDDATIRYLAKVWPVQAGLRGFYPEMALYAKTEFLRPLQGKIVPRIIGIYGSPGGTITVAMEPPHPREWTEASRALPESVKQRIVEAYVELHTRGILHGDIELRHMLVGADGRITLIDFGLARVTRTGLDGLGLHVCSAAALELEMRRVKFVLDYPKGYAAFEENMSREWDAESNNPNPNPLIPPKEYLVRPIPLRTLVEDWMRNIEDGGRHYILPDVIPVISGDRQPRNAIHLRDDDADEVEQLLTKEPTPAPPRAGESGSGSGSDAETLVIKSEPDSPPMRVKREEEEDVVVKREEEVEPGLRREEVEGDEDELASHVGSQPDPAPDSQPEPESQPEPTPTAAPVVAPVPAPAPVPVPVPTASSSSSSRPSKRARVEDVPDEDDPPRKRFSPSHLTKARAPTPEPGTPITPLTYANVASVGAVAGFRWADDDTLSERSVRRIKLNEKSHLPPPPRPVDPSQHQLDMFCAAACGDVAVAYAAGYTVECVNGDPRRRVLFPPPGVIAPAIYTEPGCNARVMAMQDLSQFLHKLPNPGPLRPFPGAKYEGDSAPPDTLAHLVVATAPLKFNNSNKRPREPLDEAYTTASVMDPSPPKRARSDVSVAGTSAGTRAAPAPAPGPASVPVPAPGSAMGPPRIVVKAPTPAPLRAPSLRPQAPTHLAAPRRGRSRSPLR